MESANNVCEHFVFSALSHFAIHLYAKPVHLQLTLVYALQKLPVIECSHYCLTGTSMSQVVDRFVFDKIQTCQLLDITDLI